MSFLPPSDQVDVSIEYFPPKSLSAERSLMTAAHALRRFKPAFQSVTFGAGGIGDDGADDWSVRLQTLNEVPTACHVALCWFNRDSLLEFTHDLWAHGIRSLVVIRGDGDAAETGALECAGYGSVPAAVAAILAVHPFDISVSAYPEIHPKAANDVADLEVLLAKQNAGATRAITQYFFNNEDFYRFRERAAKRGVRLPIIPGIMPISNFDRIVEFSKACGASIPGAYFDKFAKAGEDRSVHTQIAREIVEDQVSDLAENGVNAIHVYSLNRADLTADTIRAFYAAHSRNPVDVFQPALAG